MNSDELVQNCVGFPSRIVSTVPNFHFFYDIEEIPQEELLKLLQGNSSLFTKCTFRIDTVSRQQSYYGQLPTPDSPDIRIPGRVRRVQEDDVVVLELQPIARARDEKEQQQEPIIFGYIKGNKEIPNGFRVWMS